MIYSLAFPNIDPVIFSIGPVAIRWYALAYIAGLFLGIKYITFFVSKPPHSLDKKSVDDLLVWMTIGVVLGGRIGYVVFYNLNFYFENTMSIFKVWQGGMSFHGGLLGVIIATFILCRQRNLNFLGVSDAIACAAPIGLFFGRIANFINGELYGRLSDLPWAVRFPQGAGVPRHPSQLYEALLEGLLLFVILLLVARKEELRQRLGLLSGIFMIGYGLTRSFAEFFRAPDSQIGYFFGSYTMGQLLSVPLIIIGFYLIFRQISSR